LQLFEIVEALRRLGTHFGFAQRRKQHRRKNRNNGDHHQQLDEGEGWRKTDRRWVIGCTLIQDGICR